MMTISLTSCKLFGGLGGKDPDTDSGGTPPADNDKIEDLIYDSDSELNIVIGEGVSVEEAVALCGAIESLRGAPVAVVKPSAHRAEHEIVIGKTDREVSNAANRRLVREIEDYTGEYGGSFVVYSDGSSIAVVFTEDYDHAAEKLAFKYLKEELISETLAARAGVVNFKTFNLVEEYYEPIDTAHRNEILARAEEKLGKKTVEALISTSGLYDFRLVEWLAGLYDPCICVCKGLGEDICKNTKYCKAEGAGFYFSNSARDNVGYLPDIETARQVLDFLSYSGMCWMYDGSYTTGALPAEMLEAIGRYVRVLQSEDGYFRHPQWAHLDDYDSRLNRDLNWATTLLQAANMRPYYTTPNGVPGVGAPAESSVNMTSKLSKTRASAVSNVTLASASYPSVLESRETWAAFLDELSKEIRTKSYGTGSRLGTYKSQIAARDEAIGTPDDPTPLFDMTLEWLNYHMNPERGTWVWDEKNGGDSSQMGSYAETNGVMKIHYFYTAWEVLYPHALECMKICTEVLTTDEVPTGAVDVYNAWIALSGIYENVLNFGSAQDKAEAEAFMQNFRENATDAVLASRDKFSAFKISDGSFSYWPDYNHGYSSGMPTGIAGTKEGDVNGAIIASVDAWGYICSSLGIENIPIFGSAELYKFRELIAQSNPVIKKGLDLNYTVHDFEEDEAGDDPTDGLTYRDRSDKVSHLVESDASGENKYLKCVTSSGGGDSVFITCESRLSVAKSWVLEGDFCVMSADSEYAYQLYLGEAHMILIKAVGNKIRLVEASSDSTRDALTRDLGVCVDFGEWFRLKVIYYVGDHNTARFKIYFDDLSDGADELQLLAVTDNYFDSTNSKFEPEGGKPSTAFESVRLYSYNALNGVILLDNLAAYRSMEEYKRENDPQKQPLVYNIDPPDSPEKIYDFNNGNLPEDFEILSGQPLVTVGRLDISSEAEVNIPINVRTQGTKCASAEFNIICGAANTGEEVMRLTMTEPLGELISFVFKVVESNGKKYIGIVEKAETEGSLISGVKIPLNVSTSIRIDYHHNEDAAFIFIDGEFAGTSSKIYSDAKKFTAQNLVILSSGKASVTIDDLVFERNTTSYADAIKPSKDSVYYGFDKEDTDVILSGGAALASVNISGKTESALKLPSGTQQSSVSVSFNHRSSVASLILIDMDIYYLSASKNGETHIISYKDQSGEALYSLVMKINGELIELYEVGKGGTVASSIASAKKANAIKLSLEISPENKMVNILIDRVCVGKSSIFIDADIEKIPTTLEIKSLGTESVLSIDNLRAETVYELYEEMEVKPGANTDTANPLNFDKSSTGSLPEDIVRNSLYFRVENEYNSASGEYSNVGVLDTIAGKNENIGVRLGTEEAWTAITFEADFKLSNIGNDDIMQFFLIDEVEDASGDKAYGMIFKRVGDSFKISDYTSDGTKTTLVSGLSFDTWYKLKVQYFVIADGTARIRVYINDTLKYVTDNDFDFSGNVASKDIKQALFYTFRDSQCSIYVDNMSLTASNETCNDTVGAK